MPTTSWLSPQAQRRLRRSLTDGELADVARDLAATLDLGDASLYRLTARLLDYLEDS